MTVQEALAFINQNTSEPEVVKFLGEQSVSPEKTTEIIEAYKKSSEFKTALQSEGDRRANKERDKILKDEVPKLVEDGVKKAVPTETPEQKSLRELRTELEQIKNEKGRSEFKTQAFSTLSELGLTAKEIDLVLKHSIINDVDELKNYAQEYIGIQSEKVLKGVEDKIKASGSNPPNPKNQTSPSGKITSRDELKGMKPEDVTAAYKAGRIDIQGVNLTALKEA